MRTTTARIELVIRAGGPPVRKRVMHIARILVGADPGTTEILQGNRAGWSALLHSERTTPAVAQASLMPGVRPCGETAAFVPTTPKVDIENRFVGYMHTLPIYV